MKTYEELEKEFGISPSSPESYYAEKVYDYVIAEMSKTAKPVLKYNFDCPCGWLHLGVRDGFACSNCGKIFISETVDVTEPKT